MNEPYCILHTTHLTLYSEQKTPTSLYQLQTTTTNTAQYTKHWAPETISYTLNTQHFMLSSAQSHTLHLTHNTHYTIHYTLHTPHYTLHYVLKSIVALHSFSLKLCSVKYIVHCTVHILTTQCRALCRQNTIKYTVHSINVQSQCTQSPVLL